MIKPQLGMAALAMTATFAHGASARNQDVMVVTASNSSTNQLMFYGTDGTLLHTLPTHGQGGVSGNSGGIAATFERLAVVNFGSGTVSTFMRDPGASSYHLDSVVPALANPVSVAFGHGHLYILSTTQVESHAMSASGVAPAADGSAALVIGDGSAAQVGVIASQLIITEKSNAIESVKLTPSGAVTGSSRLVADIPANVNAPFGLVTRGNEAYVTIAHANEISLVRDDAVLTVTGSGTQMAPCWLTLAGPYLYSSNSPSMSVSRYVVYGTKIVQEDAVAATFDGDPTDIDFNAGTAAVVDSNGTVSHVSVFKVDEDGRLTLTGVATINATTTNGIAVLRRDAG